MDKHHETEGHQCIKKQHFTLALMCWNLKGSARGTDTGTLLTLYIKAYENEIS